MLTERSWEIDTRLPARFQPCSLPWAGDDFSSGEFTSFHTHHAEDSQDPVQGKWLLRAP